MQQYQLLYLWGRHVAIQRMADFSLGLARPRKAIDQGSFFCIYVEGSVGPLLDFRQRIHVFWKGVNGFSAEIAIHQFAKQKANHAGSRAGLFFTQRQFDK